MKRIFLFVLPIFLLLACASCIPKTPLNPTNEEPYLSYAQTIDRLASLAADHPEIAKIHCLGKTREGREIRAISIGFEQDEANSAQKPEILVVGGHHANEWIGIEVVRYLAENTVAECKADSEIEALLRRANIWFIPLINADGYEHSRNEERNWRKNRRFFGEDLYGVDLNRNYPHNWRLENPEKPGTTLGVGGSDDPSSRWFRGYSDGKNNLEPSSIEPEVRAILNLVESPGRNFKMFLDFHSFSELILYPPAFSTEPPPDIDAYKELAEGMAEKINEKRDEIKRIKFVTLAKDLLRIPFPLTYRAAQCGTLYSAISTGGSIDTMYYRYGMWSLAVELTPNEGTFVGRREALYVSGKGFRVDYSEVERVCQENWAGFLFAANWALSHPAPKVGER